MGGWSSVPQYLNGAANGIDNAARNAGLPPERRIQFRIGIHLGAPAMVPSLSSQNGIVERIGRSSHGSISL
jgi:hypothetical protein